jgi:predicted dehydrogenase
MHGKSAAALGIGVIGCGNISMTYLRNAALFSGTELRACTDISAEMAALRASEYAIRAMGVDALLSDPEVDLCST